MRSLIRENTDRFMIAVQGAGTIVEITNKAEGLTASVQGEDALGFLKQLEDMAEAYADPASVWHKASWNDCLEEVCGEIVAAQNPDYEAWKNAAIAIGWSVAESDMSEDSVSEGPCLRHEKLDRVMPLGSWREAVKDLGYDTAEEALSDTSPGGPS